MGRKTKIDWCDASWNPITGCWRDCEYCYARKIADRFGGCSSTKTSYAAKPEMDGFIYTLDKPAKKMLPNGKLVTAPYPCNFEPTFHRYRLDEPQKWKDHKRVFVGSMCDMFGEWVPDEWIEEVVNACIAAPQHDYLFLTKNPARYEELIMNRTFLPFEGVNGVRTVWFGTTVTTPDMKFRAGKETRTFLSIEPIQDSFKDVPVAAVDWVIIGAETGNRKGKVVPKREWIEDIVEHCSGWGVPVFMKESLRELMGDDFRQEIPEVLID